MDIRHFARTPAVTCSRTTPIAAVADLMEAHDVGSVVVLDENEAIVGIVTDRDLVVRAMADRRDLDTPVAKVMSENVIWIREDSPVFAAATEMATAGCRRMPVLDSQGTVRGMVSLDDLLVLFARQTDKLAEIIGSEVASPNLQA